MVETTKTIELLEGILHEMQGMKGEQVKTNVRLDSLETGQREMKAEQVKTNQRLDDTVSRLERLETSFFEMREEQVEHTKAIKALYGGQELIRNEIERLNRSNREGLREMESRIIIGISEAITRNDIKFSHEISAMRSRLDSVESRIERIEQVDRAGN